MNTTQYEIQVRKLSICPVCQHPKEQNALACWDCFKGRNNVTALKYYNGDFKQWVELARQEYKDFINQNNLVTI